MSFPGSSRCGCPFGCGYGILAGAIGLAIGALAVCGVIAWAWRP